MKIGPKYKIARRLGANIFDKTSTAKFAARSERDKRSADKRRPKTKTDYALQMLEKQRVRFFYGIGERQFSKYTKEVIAKKSSDAALALYSRLESRLDNVVYRLHLAPTRQAARQMVGHGHIMVNGKKTDIPSFEVKLGDVITIREGSKKSPLFTILKDNLKDVSHPHWLTLDLPKLTANVLRKPDMTVEKSPFDLSQVLEFYKR